MGFFDSLRRMLGGAEAEFTPREIEAIHLGVDPDSLPIADETPFNSGEYDRDQWSRKFRRVLAGLPATRPEWDDVAAEARSLGFEPDWVAQTYRDEFALMVRRAVADRVVTVAEHQKLDLARDLTGITDAEGEQILRSVVAEAESFFGKSVEGG